MNFIQIKETCIYMKDLGAARQFYHNLLALPIISEAPDRHIFFRAGSSVLLCFNPDDSQSKKSPPAHYAFGNYHFAFEVTQAEYLIHKEKIRALGIPILDTLIWKNGLESFYFNDPAGNVIEIVPEGIWD
ncbi:MAG: VOC family protein [Cyclobacteriaceae bacterium]|nr:VOC family protein [Cyclobacteriaceae bacterium]